MSKMNVEPTPPPVRLLRWRDVSEIIPLSRIHVNTLERRGDFPKRIRLCENTVCWRETDILKWIADKEAATTETTLASPQARAGLVKARAASPQGKKKAA
jgi:prophage regulatory protein